VRCCWAKASDETAEETGREQEKFSIVILHFGRRNPVLESRVGIAGRFVWMAGAVKQQRGEESTVNAANLRGVEDYYELISSDISV